MKLLTALLTLGLSFTSVAYAAPIEASSTESVDLESLEAITKIPTTGDLSGRVVTVYAGTAMALRRYEVIVSNMAAPCEGDDCTAYKIFSLGDYADQPSAVYSRKVNASTYSIAIVTKRVDLDSEGKAVYKKVKVLLTVKFTREGVANAADVREVSMK